jgi:hypothetical protein
MGQSGHLELNTFLFYYVKRVNLSARQLFHLDDLTDKK